MPTSEVHHIFVPTTPGSARRPAGEAVNAYYVLRGKRLIMTGEKGNPVSIDGKIFERRLRRGDNPSQIAQEMANKIRSLLVTPMKADPFNAPIVYPPSGVV